MSHAAPSGSPRSVEPALFTWQVSTTGKNPFTDAIRALSVAAYLPDKSRSTKLFSTRVKPWNSSATAPGKLRFPRFAEAWCGFLDFVTVHTPPGASPLLVAYNASFDAAFLAAELTRADLDTPSWSFADSLGLGPGELSTADGTSSSRTQAAIGAQSEHHDGKKPNAVNAVFSLSKALASVDQRLAARGAAPITDVLFLTAGSIHAIAKEYGNIDVDASQNSYASPSQGRTTPRLEMESHEECDSKQEKEYYGKTARVVFGEPPTSSLSSTDTFGFGSDASYSNGKLEFSPVQRMRVPDFSPVSHEDAKERGTRLGESRSSPHRAKLGEREGCSSLAVEDGAQESPEKTGVSLDRDRYYHCDRSCSKMVSAEDWQSVARYNAEILNLTKCFLCADTRDGVGHELLDTVYISKSNESKLNLTSLSNHGRAEGDSSSAQSNRDPLPIARHEEAFAVESDRDRLRRSSLAQFGPQYWRAKGGSKFHLDKCETMQTSLRNGTACEYLPLPEPSNPRDPCKFCLKPLHDIWSRDKLLYS